MDQYKNLSHNELIELLHHEQIQTPTLAQAAKDIDASRKLSDLTQECFTLQKQLDLKMTMERDYLDEIETLQADLSKMNDKLSQVEKMSHVTCQERHEELQSSLDTALEDLAEREGELLRVNGCLTEATSNLKMLEIANKQRLEASSFGNETSLMESGESISQLQLLVEELQSRSEEKEKKSEELLGQLDSLKQELEMKEGKVGEYFNSLQEAREEISILTAEKEALRMENNTAPGQRGNSLFAELEDRRIKAEAMLVSMQSSYQRLEVRHKLKLREIEKFKENYIYEMDKQYRSRDVSYIESLKNNNRTLTSENERLNLKLAKLEKTMENEQKNIADTLRAFRKQDNSDGFDHIFRLNEFQISELKKELEQTKWENMNLKSGQLDCFEKRHELQGDLDVTKASLTRMDFQMADMKEELEMLRERVGTDIEVRNAVRRSSILHPVDTNCDLQTHPTNRLSSITEAQVTARVPIPPKFKSPPPLKTTSRNQKTTKPMESAQKQKSLGGWTADENVDCKQS